MPLLVLLLWFLLDIVLGVFGEVVLEVTRFLNTEKGARPLAIAWFIVIGLALGAVSALAVSWRIAREGPFLGVSLLVAPALLGGLMEFGGRLRSRSHAISHLATWYGGASLGLGLAAGRLAGLTLLRAI